MRAIILFFVLFIFVLTSARAASFELDLLNIHTLEAELISHKNKRIVELQFSNGAIPENVREKFSELKDQNFSVNAIHKIINWYQEVGGDARLEVSVHDVRGGVALNISLTERPKINKIIIEGAKSFPPEILLGLLDIKDGSEIDAVAVEASAQKIISYYASEGFIKMTVRPEMDAARNLHFVIDEKSPALVQNIEITPMDVVGDPATRRRLEADLKSVLGINVGDRLIQEKLSSGLLEVRNWLRSHDFLTAKEPVPTLDVLPSGEVKIRLAVEYGPRIRFGFRENQRFSNRELLGMIAEIKEVNVGVDYIESVRRRIIDEYKDVGLINVKINTLVREDPDHGYKYVSLVIDEGKRIRIKELHLDGIYSLPAEESRKLFDGFAPRLEQRGYFHEAGIQRAGELLADYLRSKGYLSAKLEFTRFDFNEDKKTVNVFLLFNEGVQTFIHGVTLSGFKNLPEDEAKRMLALKVGEPFNVFAFERGLVSLKDKYQDLGHLTMVVANEGSDTIVSYSKDQTEANIDVRIEEGPAMRLGSIIVRGNAKTHTKVITREVTVISGDVLTRPILKESEDNIRKLDLFASVIIRPIEHPGLENVRDLLVLVEETDPGAVEFTPGFRNDLGWRGALGVSYQNLGGWHRGVSAKAVVNRRVEGYRFPEYNLSFGFREPYFANWPVTFTSNLNFLRRQFNHFDANISRITSGFRRELSKYVSGLIEYSYERSTIEQPKYPYTQDNDAKTNHIGSMIPGVIFDSRNDKFNASSGVISTNHFEWAAREFASQATVGYTKTTSNNSAYLPLFDGLVFANAFNFGFQRSTVFEQQIPTLKLFRLGGLGSIRGYQEDSIEVSGTVLKGTLTSLNYRSELRFPIFGSFGGAAFFDAGNLFVDKLFTYCIAHTSELRSSAGMGLRYNTPVGPVTLDVAKRLQADEKIGDTSLVGDTDRYRVHFAIGVF